MTMWTFVPKPRSAIKTIEWFPSLLKIEGKDWNLVIDGQHPARREYITFAHPYEDYRVFGDDIEIHARMEFARYMTLGLAYLNEKNQVVITEAGKSIIREENKSELLLRQLLKWQFPSYIHTSKAYRSMRVFPVEIILKVVEKFNVLNKLELAFSIFSCVNISQIGEVFQRIEVFKNLTRNQPSSSHLITYKEHFKEFNPDGGKPDTYLDYIDVLFRHLEYTGIFETSGRGHFNQLYVPKRSQEKYSMLVNKYHFVFNDAYKSAELFYKEFGDSYSQKLPWDEEGPLTQLIRNKTFEIDRYDINYDLPNFLSFDYQELKEYDAYLDSVMLNYNEERYVNTVSKTQEARKEILDKFADIQEGNEDDAARWLEVVTWRSLVAMKGRHFVKRNFKLNPDLTPRSFSPGTGNIPDMEFYNDEYILIPEVSIQSGVGQWIQEGSSVIDHVQKFLRIRDGEKFAGDIEIRNYFNDKNVFKIFGLFICIKTNERLLWQFYILCKESWLGQPVPVVPLEIKAYSRILTCIYENDLPAIEFERLIEQIICKARTTQSYQEWQNEKNNVIDSFVELNR